MSKIRIVKLLSGEEILSEIKSEDDTSVTLEQPVQLLIAGQKDGNPNVHMAPLLPLGAKPEVTINRNVIAYIYEPAKQLEDKHRQIFGSGLIIPDSAIQKA